MSKFAWVQELLEDPLADAPYGRCEGILMSGKGCTRNSRYHCGSCKRWFCGVHANKGIGTCCHVCRVRLLAEMERESTMVIAASRAHRARYDG
jgi:hypothetical protein